MVCRVLRSISLAALGAAVTLGVAAPATAPTAGKPAPPAPSSAAPGTAAEPAFDFVLGKMELLEGSAREAVAAFEKALSADPTDPYLHFEFASLLLRQAQFSPAN